MAWRKNPNCTFCDSVGNYLLGGDGLCPCGSNDPAIGTNGHACREHGEPPKYPDRPLLGCAQCCADRVTANRSAFERDKQIVRERLFSGVFPTGILYADRSIEVDGSYKRLAFLTFATLDLRIEAADCPPVLLRAIKSDAAGLQARRGELYQVSGAGQCVTLGEG